MNEYLMKLIIDITVRSLEVLCLCVCVCVCVEKVLKQLLFISSTAQILHSIRNI